MLRRSFLIPCMVIACQKIPAVSTARNAVVNSAIKHNCRVNSSALPPFAIFNTVLPINAVSQVIRKLRQATMSVLRV